MRNFHMQNTVLWGISACKIVFNGFFFAWKKATYDKFSIAACKYSVLWNISTKSVFHSWLKQKLHHHFYFQVYEKLKSV